MVISLIGLWVWTVTLYDGAFSDSTKPDELRLTERYGLHRVGQLEQHAHDLPS